MFSAIGQHAVAELLGEMAITIEYETVSKKTGNFNSLSFKTRDDYTQPEPEVDVPAKYAVVSSNYGATTIADGATSGNLTLDTELVDANAIVSLSSSNVVFGLTGWFDLELVVNLKVNDGLGVSADGYFIIQLSNSGASDNVFEFVGTPSGSVINFNDFTVHGTVNMNSSETVNVKIENQTGHSLDAYVAGLTITQKP